jgi:hypothetical protein
MRFDFYAESIKKGHLFGGLFDEIINPLIAWILL